jgi:hypothetical protein
MLKIVIDDVISNKTTDNASHLGLIDHIIQHIRASGK